MLLQACPANVHFFDIATRCAAECQLRVRLGRADHSWARRMRGRCSPVSGPFRSGQIGAALGGKLPFAACLAVALHWRWRRKKFYQSVCRTVELRVRSDGDPDEVGHSRAGEMPDEYSALTQCRRQGLAGVARVADEDEVSAC